MKERAELDETLTFVMSVQRGAGHYVGLRQARRKWIDVI